MTRRLQPPPHPVTGHPYVDNALRNAWREYRNYLRDIDPMQVLIGSTTSTAWALFGLSRPARTPRKKAKHMRKTAYAMHFTYETTTHYTPTEVLL